MTRPPEAALPDTEYPRVLARTATRMSPWVTLVEKSIQFSPGAAPETYHCVTQADYVGILAITPEGTIPLVRQYRPAVEAFTWEFPAGTADTGETPEAAARRELREEAGLHADTIVHLGTFIPDTGRLQVDSHAFFARASRLADPPAPEPGLEIRLVSVPELLHMMRTLEFRHQLHWAIYAAALLRGDCPELRP